MKNMLFIRCQNYNDSLTGEQLSSLLDNSVLLEEDWCCSTSQRKDETVVSMMYDNMVYMLNNFIFSKRFDCYIITLKSQDLRLLDQLIDHLNIEPDTHITIFNLTNTEAANIDNYELLNKEYRSDYYTTAISGKLVKMSYVDTTSISAFKIAKIIEEILKR